MMKTYKSSSTVLPVEWDTVSSPTTAYRNYDVEQIPEAEETPAMYEYMVDEYSMEEYNREQPQIVGLQQEAADMQEALALLGVTIDE